MTLAMNNCPLIAFFICILMGSCSIAHRADGFYPVADIPEDIIEGKAIVTTKDFAFIALDSLSCPNQTVITGKIKQDKIKKFADATERRIGKRIGFVYKDSVITAPTINCRIESGNFQINSNDKKLILEIYSKLKTDCSQDGNRSHNK